jgi:hypothetical protein
MSPATQSIPNAREWWISALDCGATRWDPERDRWTEDRQLLDAAIHNNVWFGRLVGAARTSELVSDRVLAR